VMLARLEVVMGGNKLYLHKKYVIHTKELEYHIAGEFLQGSSDNIWMEFKRINGGSFRVRWSEVKSFSETPIFQDLDGPFQKIKEFFNGKKAGP